MQVDVLRHAPSQYVGFILIMLGFLLQWPTLITLVLFPILVTMYVRLARREERATSAEFGDAYATYAAATPAFLPRLNHRKLADRADKHPAQSIDTPRERKRLI